MKAYFLGTLFIVLIAFEARASEPFPLENVVYLEGEGYELGKAQGAALREQINFLVEGWLKPKLDTVPFLANYYARWKAHEMLPYAPQHLREELRGIADGAEIDLELILIANAIPDIMELFLKPFGCSTLAIMPNRSTTGSLLFGRNLDYQDSDIVRQTWIPTVFARPGKRKILSINVPGMAGVLTAINDAGVSVSRQTSYNKDMSSKGMSSMLLMRYVLEDAASARDAIARYVIAHRTVPINVTITDPKEALVLEVTSKKFAVREATSTGTIYAANHFESRELADERHGRDARWDLLSSHDNNLGPVALSEVIQTIGTAETKGSNILAVFIDYANDRIIFGSDPEGRDTSAAGPLYELDISDAMTRPMN